MSEAVTTQTELPIPTLYNEGSSFGNELPIPTLYQEGGDVIVAETVAVEHGTEASAVAAEAGGEGGHTITLFAEPLWHWGSFTVTNSLLTSWLAVFVLVALGITLRRKLKEVPRGIQNIFEVVIEGALDLCDQVTGNRKISEKVFPIAITIFLFILLNNWLGILPGVGSIGFDVVEEGHKVFVPLFRGGAADLNTTLAMAIFSVIGANIFGIVSIGAWKMLNKFVNIKAILAIPGKIIKDPTIVIVNPITFFVGLIEIVGEFAKIASLSFRLFGNVFAGEVLLASMGALMAFVVPIPFLFLEILVGFIQALIFSMLTLVYFTIAASDHDHDEEHEKHSEHAEAAAH